MYLYLRGMRAWVGFRQTGLEYERDDAGPRLDAFVRRAMEAFGQPAVSVADSRNRRMPSGESIGARTTILDLHADWRWRGRSAPTSRPARAAAPSGGRRRAPRACA